MAETNCLKAKCLMSWNDASAACGGILLRGRVGEGFRSLSLDSRQVKAGGLFVALKGEHVDGYTFCKDALAHGASGLLVERVDNELLQDAEQHAAAVIKVGDALKALQALAATYIAAFPGLVRIGITGSVGKTTTKEICAAIFAAHYGKEQVFMTPGNMNSETGLPQAAFLLNAGHKVAIFEMATDHPGEMASLAHIVRPFFALITMIGTAHIERFGTKQAILEEKKQIFSCFTGNETALLPADDPFISELVKGIKGKIIVYPDGLALEAADKGIEGTLVTWEGKQALLRLPGKHCLRDAVAAAAIARAAGLSTGEILEGFAGVRPVEGRSHVVPLRMRNGKRVTLVRDYYNSNPDSAAAALDFCDGLDARSAGFKRRIYVLGSMKELGATSPSAHKALVERALKSKAVAVLLFGPEFEDFGDCFHTNAMDDLKQKLAAIVSDGDLVLLKASRACAFEKLDALFTEAADAA
jgi:UDP-N-acetylmuramoyl-tripeptide--D-alanyl-D-alanine ligase